MSSVTAIYQSKQVLDPRSVPDTLTADVCIIGSGAGGAVTAATLQEAGFDVLIVEEGRLFAHTDFTMKEADVYPKLYQESLQRATEDLGVAILQGRAVGGTTVVNWTTSFRTPDHVVDHWAKHHAVKGFGNADLAPHFESMEKRLAIAKVAESFMNANNRTFFDGCKKMGWKVETTSRNVHACMNSGYCGMGCPFNAKRSMLVTMVPDALEAGARLLPRTRIEKLHQQGDEITYAQATVLGDDGYQTTAKQVTIKAKRFIVSGGAINTPALLLRSAINDNDLVGTRTFLHPVIALMAEYEQKIEAWSGAPQSAASHHFADRGDKVGVFMEVAPLHPVLGSTALPGFGAAAEKRAMGLPHIAAPISLSIDGFHADSIGGRVKVRKSGAPLLDYPISPAIWEAVRFGAERLAELSFAAGARKVTTLGEPLLELSSVNDLKQMDNLRWEVGSTPLFSAHQMGGARMGDDPKSSVVRSSDLRHHRITNLHVIDGSVFPTSLGVNPQLSIYGLSHMMATRLVQADSQKHAAGAKTEIAAPTRSTADVYGSRCAPCHGPEGKGDGLASQALKVKPRDFTDGAWQKSVSDEHLRKVIVEGGPSVGKDVTMIANPDLAGKPELDALVKQLRGMAK